MLGRAMLHPDLGELSGMTIESDIEVRFRELSMVKADFI